MICKLQVMSTFCVVGLVCFINGIYFALEKN